MDAVTMMRSELTHAHDWLDQTIEGVGAEQLHWQPAGNANPIGAVYVHVVMDEDLLLQGKIRGRPTLAGGEWAGRMGLSEPPAGGASWGEWARRVVIDFDAFDGYVRAVYDATGRWAASLDDAGLDREVDFGERRSAVSYVLWRVISHNHGHAGEIAALKGLQGLQGYSLQAAGLAALRACRATARAPRLRSDRLAATPRRAVSSGRPARGTGIRCVRES